MNNIISHFLKTQEMSGIMTNQWKRLNSQRYSSWELSICGSVPPSNPNSLKKNPFAFKVAIFILTTHIWLYFSLSLSLISGKHFNQSQKKTFFLGVFWVPKLYLGIFWAIINAISLILAPVYSCGVSGLLKNIALLFS